MMKKLLLPGAIVACLIGLAFGNIVLTGLASMLLVWYANTDLRHRLLDLHQNNLSGETVKLGERDVPIADCVLESPRFRFVLPEVRQLLTWRDSSNGTITHIHLITNLTGKTLAYPAAVLRAA